MHRLTKTSSLWLVTTSTIQARKPVLKKLRRKRMRSMMTVTATRRLTKTQRR